MKKLINLFFISCTAFTIYGQELTIPAQTQYLADNPFALSPVFAGIGDNARIRVNGLAQWVGIKNAPLNQSLTADFRITDNDGIGLIAYNDKNGNTRQAGIKLAFAHHIILDYDSEQYLSFGASYNFNQFRIEVQNFDQTIFDPYVNGDRYTPNNNFDIGLLYRIKDFYLSVNASNILGKKIETFYKLEPSALLNYQVYTGYRFRQPGSDFEIEPSVLYQLFQSDKRSTTDANLKFKWHDYDDYYWAGITARFLNEQDFTPVTLGPMLGLRKSNFYFGYSYQFNTNNLLGYNSGTHMITLGIDFLQNLSNCPCTKTRIAY